MRNILKVRKLKLSQAGDTIVEVMIVLAVLGLALGISYATANAALLQAREAQENTKATGIAQSQVEALRTFTRPDAPENIFTGTPFCIDTSTSTYHVKPANDASCVPSDISYDLKISITYAPEAPVAGVTAGGTFTVVASWPDIQGLGQDHVTMSYRLYQYEN